MSKGSIDWLSYVCGFSLFLPIEFGSAALPPVKACPVTPFRFVVAYNTMLKDGKGWQACRKHPGAVQIGEQLTSRKHDSDRPALWWMLAAARRREAQGSSSKSEA